MSDYLARVRDSTHLAQVHHPVQHCQQLWPLLGVAGRDECSLAQCVHTWISQILQHQDTVVLKLLAPYHARVEQFADKETEDGLEIFGRGRREGSRGERDGTSGGDKVFVYVFLTIHEESLVSYWPGVLD